MSESAVVFLDKNNRILPEIMKKLTGANRGVAIPEFCYSFLTRELVLDKAKPLGLFLKKDTVISVRANGSCQGYLLSGDIITHINHELAPTEHGDIFKSLIAKMGQKVTISVARLRRHMTMKPDPKYYGRNEGFALEYKVLYFMRGMRLGLDIREIENKIYVASVLPDSIASMSLTQGLRVLEIEKNKATDVDKTQKHLETALNKCGYCRICVEVPTQDGPKNMIRVKIQSQCFPADSQPKNWELPKELRPLVEVGIAALKELKTEPKSILKEPSLTKRGGKEEKEQPHITFSSVTEHGMIIETPTRLTVKVPPAKAVLKE